MAKKKKKEEEYGRAFLMIQTSNSPTEDLKDLLVIMTEELWKKDIILYAGLQVGTPPPPPCAPKGCS